MDTKIYHGDIRPRLIAEALAARFNSGNLNTKVTRDKDTHIVQISSNQFARSGGKTAIGVSIHPTKEGVLVKLGKQNVLGIMASLGQTAWAAIRNPLSLIGRLDDIAQDIENLQLDEDIWETIDSVLFAAGASTEISEKLRTAVCNYCEVANPVGESRCIACGAPMGLVQPKTCLNCGYVITTPVDKCPNCGK